MKLKAGNCLYFQSDDNQITGKTGICFTTMESFLPYYIWHGWLSYVRRQYEPENNDKTSAVTAIKYTLEYWVFTFKKWEWTTASSANSYACHYEDCNAYHMMKELKHQSYKKVSHYRLKLPSSMADMLNDHIPWHSCLMMVGHSVCILA